MSNWPCIYDIYITIGLNQYHLMTLSLLLSHLINTTRIAISPTNKGSLIKKRSATEMVWPNPKNNDSIQTGNERIYNMSGGYGNAMGFTV